MGLVKISEKGTKGQKTAGFPAPHRGHDVTASHLIVGTKEAIMGAMLLIMGVMGLCYGLFLRVLETLKGDICHFFKSFVIFTKSEGERYQEDIFVHTC